MQQVVVIGVGAMGTALIAAAKAKLPQLNISVQDKATEKVDHAISELGVGKADEAALAAADLIVLAVKPQDVSKVLAELKPALSNKQTLLSIAAGVTLTKLAAQTEATVVRCMPNTPAMVGRGFSTLSVLADTDQIHLTRATQFLAAAGQVLVIPESLQDSFTAIHGSGPAYVFLLIEAMIAAAVAEGIAEAEATAAVIQTVLGAAELIAQTQESASTLRERVTSPGGTTAAALAVFEQAGFQQIVAAAVSAAKRRAAQLG
ncbi:MAG: hypothetical protein RIT32_934 [Actinomycetota bacterium]